MSGRVFYVFAMKIDGTPYVSFDHAVRDSYLQFTSITFNFVLLPQIRNFFSISGIKDNLLNNIAFFLKLWLS